jgi:2-aminoadipate transaminase
VEFHKVPSVCSLQSHRFTVLAIICDTFSRDGNLVIVEEPTYFLAKYVFQSAGMKMIPVEVDADGMKVDQLRYILKNEGLRPTFVYTIPTYHNPGTFFSFSIRIETIYFLPYS